MNIVLLLTYFTGFHSPVNKFEHEACRGAELVAKTTLVNKLGYTESRSDCVIKEFKSDIVGGYWGSYSIRNYYDVLGCLKQGDSLYCKGYKIEVPTCVGCVYSNVTNNDELTSNYNALYNTFLR